ncbi:MAG: hypothetical protein EXR98_08360 [Gemmataceae bacterium]|nr:hypothetical protein [Gemmataceae bacterium]
MRSRTMFGVGVVLLAWVADLHAQDVTWRAAKSAQDATPVTLGRPVGAATTDGVFRPVSEETPRVVRGQAADVLPPQPMWPGSAGPPVFPTPGVNPDIYNKGAVNSNADLGGFWTRLGDNLHRTLGDVTGAVKPGGGHKMFQSDHSFEVFTSPVSNPFFFEDPRALTEIRPLFIWQKTPNANPIWSGGSNFDFALRGSVAITPHISFVVSRLGFTSINPSTGTPDIQTSTGFSELLLGPKFTIIRNETSQTVAAIGLTFDIPTGSAKVLQNTGHTGLVPYFSIAQNFGRNQYGSFNFMNTTGYHFRTDNTRTEYIYSSFHLDFEIAKRFYPLVELNWRHYTRNGGARALNFEGNDFANFGSQSISGRDELTLAFGGRVKLNDIITWGIAAEFNVLSNTDGRRLDQFRLTTDFIFRY